MPDPTVRETSSPSAETAATVHRIMSRLPDELEDVETPAEMLCDRLDQNGFDASVIHGSAEGDDHAWVELQGGNGHRWTADLAPPFRTQAYLSTRRPDHYAAPSTFASQ